MTHRERVLTALNHCEPDYVPLALWGSAYGIIDGPYNRLRKYLGFERTIPPFRRRKGHTVNYMDDRVLEALDVDVRYVWLGSTDINSPLRGKGPDLLGVVWDKSGYQIYPVGFPLQGKTAEEIAEYSFPPAETLVRAEELVDRAKYLYNHTDYAIIARAPNSYGLFDQASYLRGIEDFFMDLLADPEVTEVLLDKVTQFLEDLFTIYLDLAGKYLHIIELPGDDYAGTAGPMINPDLFDRYFMPRWKRIVALIKEYNPDIKVLFHCDGDVTPFLPKLIEIGCDIHHPLEQVPNLDMDFVKREYGDRLTILGGLDIKGGLRKGFKEVEEAVRKPIHHLASGGGFILAPANHVQIDIPPENLVYAYQYARKVGKYPIQL